MLATPRFIYFDLGNVLVRFSHERACRQMSEVSGVPWERIWEFVFEGDLENQYELGAISGAEFHKHFCDATGTQPPLAELLCASSAIFDIHQPVVAIVENLSAAGIPLGILSNTNESHWQYCATGRFSLISRAFQVTALSFELKSMKPDPLIYERAAALCGYAPHEIFFVDDREENVAGALSAGYDAVLFSSPTQLIRDLHQRRVPFNL